MILCICKLVSTARRAIAGRKYPHQMAWGVAFGLLLGVIPHGNLLALLVLLVVLSLKINHAMAALTAVGTTFLAVLGSRLAVELSDRLAAVSAVAGSLQLSGNSGVIRRLEVIQHA